MPSNDPTQSKTRRKRWRRRFRSRWRTVRSDVRNHFRGNDVLHPRDDSRPPARKVADFREWFETVVEDTVVEPVPTSRQVRDGEHWTAQFVRDAYEHGVRLADRKLRDAGWEFEAGAQARSGFEAASRHGPEETVRRAQRRLERSGRTHHGDGLEQAYLDTYTDVESAGSDTVESAAREYRQAVRDGATVSTAVGAVNERTQKEGQTRTDMISDTRTVSTINEAALRRYEEVGVEEVGVDVEVQLAGDATNTWQTAGDDRVCERCAALEGNTYPIGDLRNPAAANSPVPIPSIPLHPRCRCFWVPTPVDV